ncbi:acyl carrier protein [Burkholderia cepacia]|uniref:acyl carrier protein n=1 Tax=Burkholderia cepacia TaxID=292 RepID=UPI002ABD2158|nr:acyl carrier protein [Burkholderia cepacia]
MESDMTFSKLGLDSSALVGLTGDLSHWLGVDFDVALPYDHPSISSLAVAVAIKLLLHPLLVLTFGKAAIALGAPISLIQLKVVIAVACLPSASNVAPVAERFGANVGRIAKIILVSTMIAFISFPSAVIFLR